MHIDLFQKCLAQPATSLPAIDMADESPTQRISQIFNSLSGLSELQRQQDQLLKPTKHHNFPSTGDTGLYESSNASTTSTTSSSSSATPAGHSSSSLPPFVAAIAPNTSLPSTSAPRTHHQSIASSRSTPNSPRLMPKRHRAPPAVPQRPNAAHIANPALLSLENMTTGRTDGDEPVTAGHGGSWSHFSALTEHLDVRQVNNYAQAMPEINWQERCLELQLELHRSKNQSGRIREMLRDKVSF